MRACVARASARRFEPRVEWFGGCRWLCVVDADGCDGDEEEKRNSGSSSSQGWLRKEGRTVARSLLPLLCARNINDNHFSPDSGANPCRALRKTTIRAGDRSPFHRAICPARRRKPNRTTNCQLLVMTGMRRVFRLKFSILSKREEKKTPQCTPLNLMLVSGDSNRRSKMLQTSIYQRRRIAKYKGCRNTRTMQ